MSELVQTFRDVKPKYERLGENISSVLKQILEEQKIPLFAIESRVKNEDSFLEKVSRKGYSRPFDSIEDICGVRVICYYQEDIESICNVIENEFKIVSRENKQDDLEVDQFGYTSCHYIVTLKDEWLAHPSARGLRDCKAEIQIRTMLMHTWSAISHKLLYKRESDVAPQLKRQLNRLSALIELADEQFNIIKNDKEALLYNMKQSAVFDSSGKLTSDSLVALHGYYFSDRHLNDSAIPNLVSEIEFCGFNLESFDDQVKNCLGILNELEAEEAILFGSELPVWSFEGLIRTILDLSSTKYFSSRSDSLPEDLYELVERYRKKVQP
ncbi:GTP pyrophosphokinase family protein [Vibrio chagasii]|uniref:GTP pyrophosphokinase n=1 Tax=Vibrio chagasii TaxID=170679 RepID=UPI00163EBF7B|nr:(p)ppGpp synthetase [Vibrio chagasii]